jgi:hypothetical protein
MEYGSSKKFKYESRQRNRRIRKRRTLRGNKEKWISLITEGGGHTRRAEEE